MKDEATRLCLAIEVDHAFSHQRVIEVLKRLLVLYGPPRYIRSDNGPELVAQHLTTLFKDQGIRPSRIAPGKPWQNGSNESLNGTFRRECVDAERFHSLTEARVVIEDWRRQYNHERPHSALGYQTPATAYWGGLPSRTHVRGGLSEEAERNSMPTVALGATIIQQRDSRVASIEGSSGGKGI